MFTNSAIPAPEAPPNVVFFFLGGKGGGNMPQTSNEEMS